MKTRIEFFDEKGEVVFIAETKENISDALIMASEAIASTGVDKQINKVIIIKGDD